MSSSSLPDLDLLLIIEMCNEGIEKCDARASASGDSDKAAAWNAKVRERYVRLRDQLLAELERRRNAIFPPPAVAQVQVPGLPSKPDTDAPA